ncbi:hypothetical protein AVDCRST_MAG92-963 [uncultured Coleofasciculus sp.]|uniref:Uncharacterized protein n=1 Tax=uncultured Coleofasciculus sp. TaxID=1267456 RepID=A0A6J4HR14_9CYAN|nr:hypothetical protein AVDCRST_MAG92-963 [uncultured Coleofasciculus sp.]
MSFGWKRLTLLIIRLPSFPVVNRDVFNLLQRRSRVVGAR